MKPKLSVIVCTYNREDVIANCLKSLEEQTAKREDFEVIVVDNNSTDKTNEISRPFVKKNSNFRIVVETKQGLSHSRNRGFEEAEADHVAYIDDDAQAKPEWVQKCLDIIEEHDPDIFGGPIYPYYITKKPEWFKDKYEIRIHHSETGWMPKRTYVSGSNMIFKINVLKELGGFNPDLGMVGDKLKYGEETLLCFKAHELGKKLYYDHDLIVEHLVPEYKMNIFFFFNWYFEAGKSGYYTYKESGTPQHLNIRKDYPDALEKLNKLFEEVADIVTQKRKNQLKDQMESLAIENLRDKLWGLGFAYSKYEDNFKEKVASSIKDKLLDLNVRQVAHIAKFRIRKLLNK